MKKLFALLFCFYVGAANAVIIDFEEIDNTLGNVYSGTSLDSQGFNFSNSSSSGSAILHWATGSQSNADQNGVTYSHNYSSSITTLTEVGGGAFDLTSIDFGNVYDSSPYSQSFLVTGYYQAGGSIQSAITSDALSGLQTFVFNWDTLSSVTWTETSGAWLQLDNVVLNSNDTAPVPEPTSLALLGLGLAGFGFTRKKKKI